mgnify:CR=1 FL=1
MSAAQSYISNILIVDVDPDSCESCSQLLQYMGYAVDTCATGMAASELLGQKPYALVLADLAGFCVGNSDLSSLASSFESSPDILLLVETTDRYSAIEHLKRGVRDYLLKPLHADELSHVVSSLMERRCLAAENRQLRCQIQRGQEGESLASLIDLDRLLSKSLDVLQRELGGSGGCGFVQGNGKVSVAAVNGLEDSRAEDLAALAQMKFDSGFPDELGTANPFKQLEEQTWLLPLVNGEQLKGGLIVAGAALSPRNLEGLDCLTAQIGQGFANASRYQDARRLMYTDDLTGLYNHRYLQTVLNAEIKRSQRYGASFALIFLDLDRFKTINDQYGHLAGSAALREVGRLLRDCVREVDILFRFGGDEFAAILVESDSYAARIVAERIRRVIEEHAFLADEGLDSYVTVTVGFAIFPTDAQDKDGLIAVADKAMYAGKEARNVIFGAEDLPGDE